MIPSAKQIFLCFIIVFLSGKTIAQSTSDPEFTKGTILVASLNNGLSTGFKSSTPDLYIGSIAFNPQITIVENILRVGANAGVVYNDKRLSGMFGPMAALKIKTLGTSHMGSYANLHLIAEANWGTNKQKMVGGGLGAEIFKKLHLGITAQRDYNLNQWWLQSFIGIKLNKSKTNDDE